MKRSKKMLTRSIAGVALRFYMTHKESNYNETAIYISNFFGKKYTKDDVGKIFRHIVIFGNVDSTARALCNEVNSRSKHKNGNYGRFLGYRYEYPELMKEIGVYKNKLAEKDQLKDLITTYHSFATSEMERDKYLETLERKLKSINEELRLVDMNYIFKLCRLAEKIETYRIYELI